MLSKGIQQNMMDDNMKNRNEDELGRGTLRDRPTIEGVFFWL